jgi:DNA-binding NarL/FixJ family response regulator
MKTVTFENDRPSRNVPDPIRVVLAEDEDILRETLRISLEKDGFAVVGEAATGLEAVAGVKASRPDVAILDITLPALNGIEAATQILEGNADTQIVMLSGRREYDYLVKAIRAGASGYVWKTSAALWQLSFAIRSVANGYAFISPELLKDFIDEYRKGLPGQSTAEQLTERQREVLNAVSSGMSNKQIANLLAISVKTVEKHRTKLMERLHAHNSAELVRTAFARGYMK